MNKSTVGMIAFVLVVIGGINWGLIGAFGYDIVDAIIGSMPTLVRIVYVLVGLSALYMIFNRK